MKNHPYVLETDYRYLNIYTLTNFALASTIHTLGGYFRTCSNRHCDVINGNVSLPGLATDSLNNNLAIQSKSRAFVKVSET